MTWIALFWDLFIEIKVSWSSFLHDSKRIIGCVVVCFVGIDTVIWVLEGCYFQGYVDWVVIAIREVGKGYVVFLGFVGVVG